MRITLEIEMPSLSKLSAAIGAAGRALAPPRPRKTLDEVEIEAKKAEIERMKRELDEHLQALGREVRETLVAKYEASRSEPRRSARNGGTGE